MCPAGAGRRLPGAAGIGYCVPWLAVFSCVKPLVQVGRVVSGILFVNLAACHVKRCTQSAAADRGLVTSLYASAGVAGFQGWLAGRGGWVTGEHSIR